MGIELSGGQIIIAYLGIALILLFLIWYMRRYIKKESLKDLSAQRIKDRHLSRVKSRTKYPEVDAFSYSGSFLKVGFVVSLLICILAFSYTSSSDYSNASSMQGQEIAIPEELLITPPRTMPQSSPPPPPPPPTIKEVDLNELVDNEELIRDKTIKDETTLLDDAESLLKGEKNPTPSTDKPTKVFRQVEQMPRFPGCEDIAGDNDSKYRCSQRELSRFISRNLTYPLAAKRKHIEGTVYIHFVVTETGKIADIKIIKDPGAGLGKEAKRVIELMNKRNIRWIPGSRHGKPVAVMFNLPIKFQLDRR